MKDRDWRPAARQLMLRMNDVGPGLDGASPERRRHTGGADSGRAIAHGPMAVPRLAPIARIEFSALEDDLELGLPSGGFDSDDLP
jgi:hypothetical protein